MSPQRFVSGGKCLYESGVAFRMGSNHPADLTYCITQKTPGQPKAADDGPNQQSKISRRIFRVGSHLCAPPAS
jgi:hypothetical protein